MTVSNEVLRVEAYKMVQYTVQRCRLPFKGFSIIIKGEGGAEWDVRVELNEPLVQPSPLFTMLCGFHTMQVDDFTAGCGYDIASEEPPGWTASLSVPKNASSAHRTVHYREGLITSPKNETYKIYVSFVKKI